MAENNDQKNPQKRADVPESPAGGTEPGSGSAAPGEIQRSRSGERDLETGRVDTPSEGSSGRSETEPRWREDFPIDWEQDEYVSRRELVKFVGLTSLAFVVGQFWLVGKDLFSKERAMRPAVIEGAEKLAPGESMTFQYPENSTPRILVRRTDGSYVAYDRQCSHLLCPVVPDVEHDTLVCPCHNGYFELKTGRAIAGPPRRPLPRIDLHVEGNRVTAIGITEKPA